MIVVVVVVVVVVVDGKVVTDAGKDVVFATAVVETTGEVDGKVDGVLVVGDTVVDTLIVGVGVVVVVVVVVVVAVVDGVVVDGVVVVSVVVDVESGVVVRTDAVVDATVGDDVDRADVNGFVVAVVVDHIGLGVVM